jgi:lipopolysaccharide/colanic/teichoic acid biosynthesis glycosyltransferase
MALVALPVILVLAVGVLFSLRTWPFFVQKRVGRNGRHFFFPKLRTLPRKAPRYGLKTEISTQPRSRFLALLRRTHLDELPQLLLVPIGVMTLVGPRPKMPDEFEPVNATYGAVRTRVRQGCTGLWQVSAHRSRMPHETPDYDYFYVEHASFALDLWILWHTVLATFGIGHGVELRDVPRVLARRRRVVEDLVVDLRPWHQAAWDGVSTVTHVGAESVLLSA